ncbi:hypothetical protein JOM56_014060 [Amanita muscaria]
MPLEPCRERRSWTAREDQLLREAVEREDPHNPNPSKWHAIAKHVPNRTNKDCRKRWFAKMASDVVKGGWSPEEDERLVKGIKLFGTRWSQVASIVQSRNSDQCAKRWTDTLNPSIDRSMWTPEADQMLVDAVEEHGKVWTKIVKTYFPGRTGLSAKNRYNSIMRYNSDPSRCRARRRSLDGAQQFMKSRLRPASPASLSPASSSCTTPSPIATPITLYSVAESPSFQPNMVDAFPGWHPSTSAPTDSLLSSHFSLNSSQNHVLGRQSSQVKPRMMGPSFQLVDRTMNQFPYYVNAPVTHLSTAQAQASVYAAGPQHSQQFCSAIHMTNSLPDQFATAEPYPSEIDQLMGFSSWDSDAMTDTKPCRPAMPIASENAFVF